VRWPEQESFLRKDAAVIERVILKQKWQAPRFHDRYNLVIDALIPMRTLIERTGRGETTPSVLVSGSRGLEGRVEAAARSGEHDRIRAPEVVRAEVRDNGGLAAA
jgi:hypothetical protein